MLSAILTGVNRAYPFASVPEDVYEEHVNTLFRIVHISTFKTAVQALLLILQVVSSRQVRLRLAAQTRARRLRARALTA